MKRQFMGIFRSGILLIPFVLGIASAAAQSAEADGADEMLFELQARGYAGGADSASLLVTQLYAEKALPLPELAAFLFVHNDREFRAAYAGLARKFGNLQLGLGIGSAWYDDRRHSAVSPWLYYTEDAVEVLVSVERYGNEDQEPWFYRGQASLRFAGPYFAGAYGEKNLGAGPMLGWRHGKMKIWGAVPLVSRPDSGQRGVAGVQVEF